MSAHGRHANMPVFIQLEFSALNESWNRELDELSVKLQAWLDGSRCVLIFTEDGPQQQYGRSFSIEGHDIYVLESEDITADLLHSVYLWEPQYYLKTAAFDEDIQTTLLRCVKPVNERYWRNDEFDDLALHKEFGEYIMISDSSEHRIAGEADILALQAENEAWRAAELAKPLSRKIWDALRVALIILGCLTLVLPVFWLTRQLIRQLWKGLIGHRVKR
jgi:hypothetical protein